MDYFAKDSELSGMSPDEFLGLPEATKAKIRKFAAQCCEKAFRRGFQQGWDSAKRGDVLAVDLVSWRFDVPHDISPSAHGTYSCNSEERHGFEWWNVGLR